MPPRATVSVNDLKLASDQRQRQPQDDCVTAVGLITGSKDWTTYDVTLGDVPQHIRSITVYLIYLPGTTGSAYFDDVEMR